MDLLANTQPSIQKPNFDIFSVKNRKKSPVKHSIEKPILLNFVNLSTTLCPRSYLCRVIFRFRYRKTVARTQSLIEFQKSVLITEHFQTLKNSFYEYSITYVIVSNSTKFLPVSLNITTRSRMLDIWVLHLRGVSSTIIP